ncbi:MAG: hypothetical protein JEZ09_11800 [Salinivirgaceae bacterium]|nr:hypothetical protein [Salinivirgaceae bacterium]
MKKLFLIALLGIFAFGLQAQTSDETISMVKVFGGYKFVQNGKFLKVNQLLEVTKINKQAYSEMKSAHSNYIAATIFGVIGGGMIGYPLGTAAGGGEPNWTMAAIGAGCVVISIPFSIQFNKKAKTAVKLYNQQVSKPSTMLQPKLDFAISVNGLGAFLKF